MTVVLTSTQVLFLVQLSRLKYHLRQNLPIFMWLFILSSVSSTPSCPVLSNLVPWYMEVHICVHFPSCKSFPNVWQRTWVKCEVPRQWPSDKNHMLTPTTISRVLWSVWVGHPRLELFQLVFFDLGLGFSDVVHKVKSLKTGDMLSNTNSTISCCVITGKPFKSSEPQFLLSTYLPTYPYIHLLPSSITAGCVKEEKRKYKEGSTLKTANA